MFKGKLFKKPGFWIGLALFLGFLLRVLNLTGLPIFTDEAIYIRWTQIANFDPAWRFISLTDGKQPLFIWLSMVSQRIFADPLFAGRFVSVVAGTGTTLGIYFLAKELFGKKVGLFASFLWAVFPFAVWHDRLSLMDSLLSFFTVWALWLEILLVKTRKTDIALFLGIVIGAGLLTKSSAQFLIYFLPFSLLLGRFKLFKSKTFFSWLGLSALVVAISLIINSVQRLSPFYYIVGLKNLTFIYSFREVISFGLWEGILRFKGNLQGLSIWLFYYLTPALLLLIIISLKDFKEKFKEKLLLLIYFFFPFFGLAFFGKVLYPRFMLFMTIPLVVLMAEGLGKLLFLKNKLFVYLGFLLIISYPLYFDFQTVFNQINAPLPIVDRGQYIDDWPAGWGVKEAAAILEKEAEGRNIALGTEGTFGLTPAAFEIYLKDNPNIEIKGFWPISDGISWLKEKAAEKPTYLILKDTQEPKTEWNVSLELIERYKRGKGDNYLGFYKIVE